MAVPGGLKDSVGGSIRVVVRNLHATFKRLDEFLHASDYVVAFGFECICWIQVAWRKNKLACFQKNGFIFP